VAGAVDVVKLGLNMPIAAVFTALAAILFIAFLATQAGLFPPLTPSPSHPAG
jgi:hypothetical protein